MRRPGIVRISGTGGCQRRDPRGGARGAEDATARRVSGFPELYETFQSFYWDAGRGEAAAKVISAFGLQMGYLPALRELSKAASAEASRLLNAGDGAGAKYGAP